MANQVGHVTPCCNCGHVCTTPQCGRFTSSECAERRTSYNPVFTLTPPFSRLSNTSVSSGLSSVFTESPKCRRCLSNDMEGPVSNGDGSKRERYDHDECVFNLDSSMQTFRHSLPTRCQRCSKSTPTKLRCSFAHSEPGFLPVDLLRFGGESLRNPSVSMNSSRSGIFFTTDSSLDNKAKVDFSTWGAPGRCIYMGQKEMNVYDMTVVGNCIVASDADKVKIYVIDAYNKVNSFGTPTWPRYGRGLTSTHDGKAVAVCHLNEVCVYSLKGEVIQRFGNEYFSCCWGITCNNDGNYVITESKRGVVYVVDACGRVLREIGARNIEKNRKPSIKPTKQQPGQDPRTFTNQVKLSAPRYVATNYKNQIIVTDTGQKKPFVLNYDGKVCLEIGGSVAPGCQLCKGDISPSIQDHDVTEASSEYSIFDQPLDASTEHIIPQKRGRLHRCFSYVIRKLTRKSRKRRDTVQNIADFTTPIVKENTRSSYPREVLPSIQDSNDDEISFRTCEECGVVDPRGVCIDDQNNILIADKAQHRVSLFTPKGEFMRHVLTYADDVFEPRILCVINHKTLAVADGTLKIKLFNFNAV